MLLNIVNYKSESLNHYVVNSTNNIRNKVLLKPAGALRREWFNDQLYESTYSTLSGITNHVRKIFHKHKGCIKNFTRKKHLEFPENIEICPYAFAYANWRKHIEGYSYYWEIENGWKPEQRNTNRFFTEFAYKQDQKILENVLSMTLNTFDDELSANNITTVRWVINKILSFLAIAHLNHWTTPNENKNSYKNKQMKCPLINKASNKYSLKKVDNPYFYLLNSLNSKPPRFFERFHNRVNKQQFLENEIRNIEFKSRDTKAQLEKKDFYTRILEKEEPMLIINIKNEMRLEIAKNLLSLNVEIITISKATGLSEETISNL